MTTATFDEGELYDYLARLDAATLPESTRSVVRALVLDHLGCALFGMDLPWTRTVIDVVLGHGHGSGRSPIYGRHGTLDAAVAALINGTAAHGFDLDDTHLPTMTHPGAIVIAAALAVGAEVRAAGTEVLSAVVAGYEAMTRLGRAVGLPHGELGFHGTGMQGPVGAATAAVMLLGGGAEGVRDAVGIAASLGSGIKAFGQGPGMVKRLHAGRAAESGVLAARLATGGFRGPTAPLTGKFGLAPVLALGGPVDLSPLSPSADAGPECAVDTTYIKPYPACAALHGAISAAESVRASHPDLTAGQITSVNVSTSRRVLAQNDVRDVNDPMSAQYSMPYAIAATLVAGGRAPAPYLDPDHADNVQVHALAARVALEVDDEVEAAYPDRNLGRVAVTLADGRTLEGSGESHPSLSSGWHAAVDKFTHLLQAGHTGAVVDTTVQAVATMSDMDDVTAILEAMAP